MPLTPSTVAVIVAVCRGPPHPPLAHANPLEPTSAIVLSELVHVTSRPVSTVPVLSVTIAAISSHEPGTIVAVSGRTETAATGGGPSSVVNSTSSAASSRSPARSATSVVMRSTYSVVSRSLASGSKYARMPSAASVTDPGTT